MGRAAETLGFQTFAVDVKPFEGIHLVKDILTVTPADIPFSPDVIWASPVCTTYSIAAISHHRRGITPVSEFAKVSDALLDKTLQILAWFPRAKFFIENPVGMMRKMPQMQGFDRVTVNYCRYGDIRMKPTDIWTNHRKTLFQPGWEPRPPCHNGNRNCHHQPAPRGSRTGTQGLKNDYERSKIPTDLVKEILTSV